MITKFRASMILSVFALAACTSSEPRHQAVIAWLGPELHGELRGEVAGARVDVIAGADEVACKREYAVPDPDDPTSFAAGQLKELEVSFQVTIDGVERRYELELYGWHELAAGTQLRVVPDPSEGAAIPADAVHVELQWEWELGDELIAFEEIATGGVFEIHELSGQAGADGLVIPANDGEVGGFLELELPGGAVAISFTAPCTDVEFEPIK